MGMMVWSMCHSMSLYVQYTFASFLVTLCPVYATLLLPRHSMSLIVTYRHLSTVTVIVTYVTYRYLSSVTVIVTYRTTDRRKEERKERKNRREKQYRLIGEYLTSLAVAVGVIGWGREDSTTAALSTFDFRLSIESRR